MLHFWCWRWALYTKTEIAQIFYIPISSRLMLLHTHLSSPGCSCLCWTRTAKREPRSQPAAVAMVSQTLPLAVTLLPAPSRCPCSALPECHQTNTYKPNCCPFAAHMYLAPSCTASSPSPSAEGADTTAATHHQSHQQMLVIPGTPLGLAWAIAPDYRAEGQTATFCQCYQWDLPLIAAPCALMLRFASCGIQPQHCSAPCVMPRAVHPSALWQFTGAANSGNACLFSELASSFVATLYLAK